MPKPKPPRAFRAPRIQIQITEENINLAERDSSAHCMIADAIKRNVPEAKHILVDLQSIRWTDTTKSRRFTYLTPRVAQVALIAFDQGVHDQPFRFVLFGGQSNAVNIGKKNGGPYERKALINRGAKKPPLVRGGRTPPV